MMLIINIIPTVHNAEVDRNSFASKTNITVKLLLA